MISAKDMASLNTTLKDSIFQHGLSYERLGDGGLQRVLEKATEIGAKYGRKGAVRFDLSASGRKFISPDSCRLSLQSDYKSLLEFWKPILLKATELGIVVFYTDIGKDKINNRSMMNICAGFTLPAFPD